MQLLKEKRIMFRYVIMIICILFSIQLLPSKVAAHTPIDVRLDTKNPKIELTGSWVFFNELLLTDVEAAAAITRHEGQSVNVPIEYNQFLPQANTYGTFATKITIPSHYKGKILTIQMPYAYSAVKIFAHNQFILESGTVGKDAATHETMLERKIGHFHVTEQTFTIAVQISSFNHIRGGFANPIILGEPAAIQLATDHQNFMMLFIIGILTIIGLLTILLGLYERSERRLFIFGLFALVFAIRTLVTVPFLYRLLPLPISYELATRIEYLTTILIGYLYTFFIYTVFKDLFQKWLVYLNIGILTYLGAFILFTEPVTFQTVFFKGFILEVALIIYNVSVISRALLQKRPLALANAIGVSIVFIGMIIDYLSGLALINVFPVSHLCTVIHVVIIVVSISRNYAAKAKEATTLNEELLALNRSLDTLVQQRTHEIHLVNEELSAANKKLSALALHDGLTSIYNRHYFDQKLHECFNEATATSTPLSILLFDLDEFKKYNDYYGHILGDTMLRSVSHLITEALPDEALFARYGGEEFVIILPSYTRPAAASLAQILAQIIEQAQLEHLGRDLGIVTVSIGGATYTNETPIKTEIDLLELADQQLYKAKEAGRNQVQFI